MNRSTLMLIVIISFLSTIVSSLPFLISLFLLMALTGVMVKYSFCCLQQTARGLLIAPDISDGFGGGVRLILLLMVVLIAMSLSVYAVGTHLGGGFAGLLSIIYIVGLPAVLINFALTEELSDALNPLSMFRLIAAIGLPYGLLLVFIMIMAASVGVISELIGNDYSIISSTLQSIVFYYYLVVTFHIMGYIIFQSQGDLGFVAREDYGDENQVRPSEEILLAKSSVLVKEGDYDEVIALYKKALVEFPNSKVFNERFFEFLYATKNVELLNKFSQKYFRFLIKSRREDLLYRSYRRVLRLIKDYMPDTAELRFSLANCCHQAGDPLSAVKLINGLHRSHPGYSGLAEAYDLMAKSLDDMPNMEDKAEKCRKLVSHFNSKLSEKKTPVADTKVQKKTTLFSLEE
ncbi:M48 family metallopeptidase [Motiliproteus sp. MSK22-1]|uniref:tetratricopeptide repeat protein n=1 Tax=Motiliproteus sp. MSK22-1 TaxID=1897630 RepID=UPI00097590DB|nr:hypothetical protein [Motiliproteus sp. MSK22-1]OMH26606.1 hypothetical protein BGP75_23190 [Motiliproteus sp. MSK22-1]